MLIPLDGLAEHRIGDPDRMAVARNTAPALSRIAHGHCSLFLGLSIYYHTMSRGIELCRRAMGSETARSVKRLKEW